LASFSFSSAFAVSIVGLILVLMMPKAELAKKLRDSDDD
jgi:hypothetical protein